MDCKWASPCHQKVSEKEKKKLYRWVRYSYALVCKTSGVVMLRWATRWDWQCPLARNQRRISDSSATPATCYWRPPYFWYHGSKKKLKEEEESIQVLFSVANPSIRSKKRGRGKDGLYKKRINGEIAVMVMSRVIMHENKHDASYYAWK